MITNVKMIKKIEYYLKIANQVAEAWTCNRAKVWAVIVVKDCIASTWYNWAARWLDSCNDVWCNIVNWHCTRTLHAEENAIIQAARLGISIYWATMYCTTKPCQSCIQRLINAWISEIIYLNDYKWDYIYRNKDYKNLKIKQYFNWELIETL